MDANKNQRTLKSTLFVILIFLVALCNPQNAKAEKETEKPSDEFINKLANKAIDGNSVDRSGGSSLGSNSQAKIEAWKVKHREIDALIKREMRFGISYDLVKKTVPKDQLPVLYTLLDDEKYAPYWANIAKVIGLISDDPNSVPVLLKYLQRDDGKKVNDLIGKIWTLAYTGKIGGDAADAILKKANTKEGAKELVKDWLDEQLWQEKDYDKEYVVGYIRNAALKGLIFTGKPENWKIIEDLYNQNKEITIKDGKRTDIMGRLTEAMGTRDFIVDHNNDVEAYFRIEHDKLPGTMSKYIQKYRFSY
jgi:hypothetical protein